MYFILAWNNKKQREGGYATAEIYAEALDKGAALALEYENCVAYELRDDNTCYGMVKWKNGVDDKGNIAMPYDGTAVEKLFRDTD